ncbi:transglutaminase domain-containing protein [Acidobacteria bacterium AH-259-A15]|nr:transglutaminase domain-containing protein [Acidobacteria bacterium AH-259-A15]
MSLKVTRGRVHFGITLFIGVFSLSIPIVIFALSGRRDAPKQLRTRTFELTYKARITKVPPGTNYLEVWLPYPKSDENQEIFDIQIDSPANAAVYTEPVYNNPILHVSIDKPESLPYDIQLKFKVQRREYLRKDFSKADGDGIDPLDPEVEKFLRPKKLVPITDEIRGWATDVTKGKKTDLEKARAIYDYAISILKYDKSGQGWGRGDLLYACDEKRGNCTDFHALFTGFCRAVGIPARFAIGVPLPSERGQGEIPGYHCWAEFYLRGYGWVPVDASEAWKHPEKTDYFFGGHDENRVQFSIGRDIVLRPQQRGDPLNYFVYPYVEADGKPISDTVDHEFYFRDISNTKGLQSTRD